MSDFLRQKYEIEQQRADTERMRVEAEAKRAEQQADLVRRQAAPSRAYFSEPIGTGDALRETTAITFRVPSGATMRFSGVVYGGAGWECIAHCGL